MLQPTETEKRGGDRNREDIGFQSTLPMLPAFGEAIEPPPSDDDVQILYPLLCDQTGRFGCEQSREDLN